MKLRSEIRLQELNALSPKLLRSEIRLQELNALSPKSVVRQTSRIECTVTEIPAAMAAGVTKRLWEISGIVDVLEAWEASNGSSATPALMTIQP